jgi:hypothetical protein
MLKNNSEIHVWLDLNEKQQSQQQLKPPNNNSNANINTQNFVSSNPNIEIFDNINFDNEDNSMEYVSIDSCQECDRNSIDLIEKLGNLNSFSVPLNKEISLILHKRKWSIR